MTTKLTKKKKEDKIEEELNTDWTRDKLTASLQLTTGRHVTVSIYTRVPGMTDNSQYLPSSPFSLFFTSLQDSAGTSGIEPMTAAKDMTIRKHEVRPSKI